MASGSKLKIAAAVIGSFIALLILILYLALRQTVSIQQAGLMSVAVFGMYVGFGTLIAVYRMISKLD